MCYISEDSLNGDEMYSFDSGTEISDEFRKIWREVTGIDCTNNPILVNSDSDLLKFPTIILQIIPPGPESNGKCQHDHAQRCHGDNPLEALDAPQFQGYGLYFEDIFG